MTKCIIVITCTVSQTGRTQPLNQDLNVQKKMHEGSSVSSRVNTISYTLQGRNMLQKQLHKNFSE